MHNHFSIFLVGLLLASVNPAYPQTDELIDLVTEISQLELELQLLEDENDVENLQRIFGFYIDKKQWTQAADLFADNGTIEVGGEGVYVGKARVLEYLMSLGNEGIEEGILNDHMQLQPVVHVHPDGTARGRWHHFSQEAVHSQSHHWGAGIYENAYIKEDGVWKIQSLHLYTTMRTPFDDGWHVTALPRTEPNPDLPPDLPPTVNYENYPAVYVVPFHYENPVTGSDNSVPQVNLGARNIVTNEGVSTIYVQTDDGEKSYPVPQLEQVVENLGQRVMLLEDADAVERLHTIYGYYLARNQWDDLTGIFAPDGTIEIAMRGVYRGAESIRRNLNLYGVQDELHGELHNHMQYQPVIHINDDGQSANMRSRALSMMGSYGNDGRWMGGVYENTFVKRDGVWMINTDQVFNTYFASFNDGWKDINRTAPPGITDSNPPDEPPTSDFEMFPKAFLPPYHYANPVTGRTETK